MKEYSFEIDKQLATGLRRDFRQKKNALNLVECINLEPTSYGLASFAPLKLLWTSSQLYNMGIEFKWPFPQLLKLKKFTLLLGANYIFVVADESWELTQLDTYNFYNHSNKRTIKAGHIWQVIDFWDTFILTNGMCTIWYDRHNDKLLVEDSVRITCGVDYKGRALFGGFDPNHYWSAAWKAHWAANPSTVVGEQPRALGANFVKWTMVGGGDLDQIFDGVVDYDHLLRNDQGEMPMPHNTLVCHMKKLADKVLIYSYDSVAVVSHKSKPISTISPDRERLANGISSLGALGGNEENHIYVDGKGSLVWIDSRFQVRELGYREYLESMLGTDIIVSYNELFNCYYIANADKTLMLTWDEDNNRPQGLAEVKQRITSCISIDGDCFGLGSEVEEYEASLCTDVFDLERKGIKSIRWIGLEGEEGLLDETEGSIYFRVHYRYSHRDRFLQTSWHKVNKEGMCYFPIAGVDFKVEMKANDFRLINISRIIISFQFDDNRFTRGIDITRGS